MADDTVDYRAMMRQSGVLVADDAPPPTPSETMLGDSLGLTISELRFTHRLGVEPARYAASKSIRTLADFEAEMRRRAALRSTGED